MTAIRHGRLQHGGGSRPSWWTVFKSTVRVHRSDALIPVVTAAFVVVFALVGYLLARHGGGT